MKQGEQSALERMHRREYFGLLPPQVQGYDPEASKVQKAYNRAFFESGYGFALMLVGIALLVGCCHWCGVTTVVNGFSAAKAADGEPD